jgi:hypothetical protein
VIDKSHAYADNTSNVNCRVKRNPSPTLFSGNSRGSYDFHSNQYSDSSRQVVKKTSASGEQKRTPLVLLRVAVCALGRQLIIPRFFITVTVAAAVNSWRFLCYTNICRILTQKRAAVSSLAADRILKAWLTEEMFCPTFLPLARSRGVLCPMRGRPLLTLGSMRVSDGICRQSFA